VADAACEQAEHGPREEGEEWPASDWLQKHRRDHVGHIVFDTRLWLQGNWHTS